MKNFIRFLEAEFNAVFNNIIILLFWKLFDNLFNFYSNVDQNS